MRKAFTLIELLVVISIIALLIAILLPVLSSSKRSAVRMQCASNIRQLATANTAIATERRGYFPLTARTLNAQQALQPNYKGSASSAQSADDHVSWINTKLFEDFGEYGMTPSEFTCPNRGEEFIKSKGDWWRIGYYTMSGRYVDGSRFKNGATKWVSPMSLEGPSDLVMATDVMEYGTLSPNSSSYSHGTDGLVFVSGKKTPEEAGSQGGNHALADGSVQWFATNDTIQFAASVTNNVKGYWWDSQANDNP